MGKLARSLTGDTMTRKTRDHRRGRRRGYCACPGARRYSSTLRRGTMRALVVVVGSPSRFGVVAGCATRRGSPAVVTGPSLMLSTVRALDGCQPHVRGSDNTKDQHEESSQTSPPYTTNSHDGTIGL